MTDQANLERAYRRLLAWYPREFRDENGPEILAVLMASAPDGQRRPGLAESADLIRSGLWMRLRPGVPRSARTVRAAVRFIYIGAAVSTVNLIILLPYLIDLKAFHLEVHNHPLTTAQLNQWGPLIITVTIVLGLVPIALWLWMARANGRGRIWARTLSTVLFGVATLDLTGAFQLHSAIGIQVSTGMVVPGEFGPTIPVLTWLAGLAAVWLLWRPASTAFFRPPGSVQALHQFQMAELARIRSSGAPQAAGRYAIPGELTGMPVRRGPKGSTWVSLAILMVIIFVVLWALPPN
jgi:hypothetical protein